MLLMLAGQLYGVRWKHYTTVDLGETKMTVLYNEREINQNRKERVRIYDPTPLLFLRDAKKDIFHADIAIKNRSFWDL